jgi:cytochrome c nitrite reductase small subunit
MDGLENATDAVNTTGFVGVRRTQNEVMAMLERFRTTKGKLSLFAAGGLLAGVVLGGASMEVISHTDSPEFCSSCHIMDSVFGSFQESNHAHLDCNDCHAPTDGLLITKLSFKARAGAGHMWFNTIGRGSIPDVLHATSSSVEVVNANCMSCHEPSISDISHGVKETCSDCHRSVPHGRGMYRPNEWYEPMERTPAPSTTALPDAGGS